MSSIKRDVKEKVMPRPESRCFLEIIIGVDFHPEFQEIAAVDSDSGEYQEKHLTHPGEAEQFYRCLASLGQAVRVGMEASGHGRWFERLLEGLGLELWRGDATVIRAKRGRKQKRGYSRRLWAAPMPSQ